jgi:uncharacterized protein
MLIEFRASPIHGTGGFATGDIPSASRIIEYVGKRIDKRESARQCQRNNPFIFFLNSEQDLDGDVDWNPARFLNHSCSPNCEAELIEGRIWIIARRDIKAGEEITFNYGYDLESFREYPCHCGSRDCVGYIVAGEFHAGLADRAGAPGHRCEKGAAPIRSEPRL